MARRCRSYGAKNSSFATDYKHCAPTERGEGPVINGSRSRYCATRSILTERITMPLDKKEKDTTDLQRRSLLKNTAAATIGFGALNAVPGAEAHSEEIIQPRAPIPEIVQQPRPTARESVKITKLETFLVKPRWLFLKVHTNAGVVGLGEPITEGRALNCATAIKEIEPYLVGKDPRSVTHHWQAIYRHAFYRGGPILTSALSGIDQALWDIKGKLLGVPVYELLGGPTRQRIRVYAHAKTPEVIRARAAQGFTAFKTGPARLNGRYARPIENKAWIENAVARSEERRVGKECRSRWSPY